MVMATESDYDITFSICFETYFARKMPSPADIQLLKCTPFTLNDNRCTAFRQIVKYIFFIQEDTIKY